MYPPVTPPVTPPVNPSVPHTTSKFHDVRDHWAKPYIAAFENTGWVSGFTPDTFDPNMNMTRGIFVTVLGRMNNAPHAVSNSFSDVPMTAYYAPYMEWARKSGVTSGVGNGLFAPDNNITRQEMA